MRHVERVEDAVLRGRAPSADPELAELANAFAALRRAYAGEPPARTPLALASAVQARPLRGPVIAPRRTAPVRQVAAAAAQ